MPPIGTYTILFNLHVYITHISTITYSEKNLSAKVSQGQPLYADEQNGLMKKRIFPIVYNSSHSEFIDIVRTNFDVMSF